MSNKFVADLLNDNLDIHDKGAAAPQGQRPGERPQGDRPQGERPAGAPGSSAPVGQSSVFSKQDREGQPQGERSATGSGANQ